MIENQVIIRVRYSETDRMGYVYYGNYAAYFEVARVETLRKMGVNYKDIEDEGILLPVVDFKIKYLKPAYYDEELTIKLKINKMPGVRLHFEYETRNVKNELLNTAETTLVFMNEKTQRPMQIPKGLKENFARFFK